MLTRLRWRFGVVFAFFFLVCFWGYSNIHHRAQIPVTTATVTDAGEAGYTEVTYELDGKTSTWHLGKTHLQVGDQVQLHCRHDELGDVCFEQTTPIRLALLIGFQLLCGILMVAFFIPEIARRWRQR